MCPEPCVQEVPRKCGPSRALLPGGGGSGLGIRLLLPWPRAVSGTNQGFPHQQLAGAHCHLLDTEAAVSGVPRKSYLWWDTETQAWGHIPWVPFPTPAGGWAAAVQAQVRWGLEAAPWARLGRVCEQAKCISSRHRRAPTFTVCVGAFLCKATSHDLVETEEKGKVELHFSFHYDSSGRKHGYGTYWERNRSFPGQAGTLPRGDPGPQGFPVWQRAGR